MSKSVSGHSKNNFLFKRKFTLGSQYGRLGLFAAFWLFVLLTGGSSRDDMGQLILLRPGAILFGALALCYCRKEDLFQLRAPLAALCALILLMILHLVPLPPSIWHNLPGRGLIAAIDSSVGFEELWRPLALSPSRAWNALWAMSVPLSALLLFAILEPADRKWVMPIVIAGGLISTLWGVLQFAAGPASSLYSYRITNTSSMVGAFANRNHQSVFLVVCLILSAGLMAISPGASRSSSKASQQSSAIRSSYIFCLIMILMVPMIIAVGSRSGLILGGLSLLAIIPLVNKGLVRLGSEGRSASRSSSNVNSQGQKSKRFISKMRIPILIFIGLIPVILGTIFIVFDRAVAVKRLLDTSIADELRAQVEPVLQQLSWQYLPFGTGFGSFEFAYKIQEPDAILGPGYLNNAHNDFYQLVIEAGLPGLAILAALLVWAALRFLQCWRERGRFPERWVQAYVIGLSLAILALASISDYPMRTPIMMCVASWLMALLATTARNGSSTSG